MFTKQRQRSIWSNSGRNSRWGGGRKQPVSWKLLLAGVPLALVLVEVATRLVVGAMGKTQELKNYDGEAPLTNAYRLKYVDRQGNPYDSLPNRGQLQAQRSPLLGYKLLPNQKSAHWSLNAQGFRADQPTALARAANEFRIVILGSSAAFGQLSASNAETFGQILETRLNQQTTEQQSNPGKFRPDTLSFFADEQVKELAKPAKIANAKYQVINMAVPGYASGNELAQLVTQTLAYQPNLIILMNGYGDLTLPSNQEAADVPKLESRLDNSGEAFLSTIGENLRVTTNQLYTLQALRQWVFKPHEGFKPVIPPTVEAVSRLDWMTTADSKELDARVARYDRNLRQIASLTRANKIPLLVAVQPEITSRTEKGATEREKGLLKQMDAGYSKNIQSSYQVLGRTLEKFKKDFAADVTTLNLYIVAKEASGEWFQDPVHLTPEANKSIANRMYELLVPRLQQEPKPFSGGTAPPTP